MKYKIIFAVLLISIIVVVLFWRLEPVNNPSKPDFFVGVDTAYDNVEDIKKLVDEIKDYTNFFGIGSTGIVWNFTKLDEVCQYVCDSGLYFMVYEHPPPILEEQNQTQWVADAKQKWGNCFLGLYVADEFGGHQIDADEMMRVKEADNYTDASNKYVDYVHEFLRHYTGDYLHSGDLLSITADYALYWFDYQAGYDVVLSEFGWNHSRLLNIALNRGAANMHNKDWGAIITWTYREPPYLESADELYYDMVLAYLSGAKYVIILNYSQEKVTSYGTLTEEHLDAMKRFWEYIHTNPERLGIYCPTCTQIAYVLPKDYAWGFRGSDDKVWGIWVDELSITMGKDVDYLLHTHHLSLDIIYDDPNYYNNLCIYSKLYFWNGTVMEGFSKCF
jgi:hypothetical protein